jgi:CO/xanthine dehydrogenase FAD-binding subunit
LPLYLRPTQLRDAVAALAAKPLSVLAGGTDFYPARVGRPLTEDVLDVTAIGELGAIEDQGSHWRIGAAASWRSIAEARLPSWCDALLLAGREVGGAQIQNAGTLGGNLCNASPAADGVPALLALDATVELASVRGRRTLPLGAFATGPRCTARASDELLTAVSLPKPASPRAASHFLKLGSRRYLVISFAMVAVALEVDAQGRIEAARVAVGACSPVAVRLPGLEADLLGRRVDDSPGACATIAHLEPLAPIDDVRADAGYRRTAALVLVRRAIDLAGAKA